MSVQSCIVSSLSAFIPTPEKPWNRERIQHFYNRFGYGASGTEVDAAMSLTPAQLVDQIFDTANIAPLPADNAPFWANYENEQFYNEELDSYGTWDEIRNEITNQMISGHVRTKMAQFWSNHFVTEFIIYEVPKYMFAYHNLLHQFAYGNFKSFVTEISKSGAMLVYLNGNENTVYGPNENYARELMELFTMGEGNGYTQYDIAEMARALTGWRARQWIWEDPFLDTDRFDNGLKTIFGQTGNWGFDDVHDLIFDYRASETAYHICEKIYKYFVVDEVNDSVVATMAETLQNSNWDIMSVIKQLAKSEHFFEDGVIGAKIKQPMELFTQFYHKTGINMSQLFGVDDPQEGLSYLNYWTMELGQQLLSPVDVAGWPGQRTWINENTLAYRWGYMGELLNGMTEDGRQNLWQTVVDMVDDLGDLEEIVTKVAAHFLSKPLSTQYSNNAVQALKGQVPDNYFEDGTWSLYFPDADWQVVGLMTYLSKLPEFQLM